MKTSQLKAGTKRLKSNVALKTTKPLKAAARKIVGTSKRVEKFNREYNEIRPFILELDNNRCRFVPHLSKGDSDSPSFAIPPHDKRLHVHHIKLRSHGGSNLPSNLITVCGAHHEFIHEHSDWSRENGWIA